jgi:hypothetical protein
MSGVSPELLEIAERIATTENRHNILVGRIERLKEEGSDPTQAMELLSTTRNSLNQLYGWQASMRRQKWLSKAGPAISLPCEARLSSPLVTR